MEYRVRYRNIPWSVALSVLPGKIIGTFFIKPWLRFRRNWKRTISGWFQMLLIISIVAVVFVVVSVLLNKVTEGELGRKFYDMWHHSQLQTEPAPPPDVTPTAEEILELYKRNHR